MIKRVAVVGAGAAGLCALRHLTALPGITAVGFEQTKEVGGTWVYTEKVGKDDHGLPSHASMYINLKTNLPKEVMAFPDFSFPSIPESFLTHEQVLQYLNDYSQNYDLMSHIKFNTCVEKIEPRMDSGHRVWDLWSRNLQSTQSPLEQQQFDAVIVCNGHYSVPLIPDLPGLSSFQGQVVHSHDYRHPEVFADQRLVLLGAASSGQDISLDVAAHAKQVILCHRKPPISSPLPANVRQAVGISRVDTNSIVLEDGEVIQDVDVLLFCTGYKYVFPFLAAECHPEIQEERVPLYKHIVHPAYPTLAFMGIPKTVCPFPQFDCQVRFTLAGFLGSRPFPSQAEMEKDIARDFQWRLDMGMPHRHAHHMGKLQWAYNDELAKLGGFEPIPRVVQKLYDYVHEYRATALQTYKRRQFTLADSESFKEITYGP